MLTLVTVAGVVVAMLAVQALVLLAHSLQNRMGTMPIGMVVGILTFGTWAFAGFSPYVELSQSVFVPLLSVVLYSNLLCLVLTVYICDGTNYTRRLLLIVMATYLLTFATLQIMEYGSYWGTIKLARPIPEGIFISNWRIRLSATLAMAFSFLVVPAFYQLLTNRAPAMARTLRAAIVLVTVFTFDGLLYLLLAFANKPFFSQFVVSHSLVKCTAALILTPGVAIYTKRVLQAQARGKSEVRPLFDVVSRVTEMDRELETLLSTMVDGLILFTQDGTIVRVNAAAERLIGQPLAGRRLDDPILRMSHPDGSRFPHTDSPLLRTLRARTPIENVELAFQRHDGGRRIISVNASPLLDSKRRLRGGMATFRDVTQRREIDESLAASQDFLRRLIEQAPVGIAVFDAEGLAEHLNERFLDYLSEKNPNQLLGRFNIFKDSFLTQSDLLKNVILAYKGKVVEIPAFGVDVEKRQVVEIGGFFSGDAPAATTRRIISALLFPINDRFEKVRNVVVLLTDLTERYRAEHQQKHLEERYQRIVTRVSDYIFSAVVDFDTFSYEFCTPSVEKITGYSDDFFMSDGWFWFKIINHDDQSRVQDELLKIITKGADEGVLEYRIRHRLQGTRWVRNHLTVLRNEKDRVDRVIGVVSDITSQKDAEAALRRTVDRFRALVENLNELLFTIDVEAKISFTNKAFKTRLGYKERSVLGTSVFDYLHRDDVENVKVAVSSHLEASKPIRAMEVRIRRNDGHYLTLIANADLIYDEYGALEGSLWVAFDATEIRRAEQVYR